MMELRKENQMIVAGPEILAELEISAAIINNVLVIVGRGSQTTVANRQFHSIGFPGLSSFEAHLITRGEGEIIINKSIIVPILRACTEDLPSLPMRSETSSSQIEFAA
jgi:hypothetical protein